MTTPTYSPITSNLVINTISVEDRAQVLRRLFQLGYTRNDETRGGDDTTAIEKNWPQRSYPTLHVYRFPTYPCERYIGVGPYSDSENSISSFQFFSTYGPYQEDKDSCASDCSAQTPAPENPINFIVDTHDDKILSEMVQELAVKTKVAEKPFGYDNKRYIYIYRETGCLNSFTNKPGMYHDYSTPCKGSPVYSASTQFGEIVRLLSTPVKPPAPVGPTIHSYTGTYKSGDFTVKFGCAEISTTLVNDIVDLFYKRVWKGNRKLASITLDSGKTLTIAQLQSIQDYVRAVEEYKG